MYEVSLSHDVAQSLRKEVHGALENGVRRGVWTSRPTGESRTDYFLPDSSPHVSAYVENDEEGEPSTFQLVRFGGRGERWASLDTFDILRYSEETITVPAPGERAVHKTTLSNSDAIEPTRRLLATMTGNNGAI